MSVRHGAAAATTTSPRANDTPPPPRFRDVLARTRKELRLNQVGIGRAIAVTGRTVARWEHGEGKPDLEHLRALVRHVATIDGGAADALAASMGHSRVTLGLAAHPAQPVGAPDGAAVKAERAAIAEARKLAFDGLVCTAADALDLSPRALRPALLAIFARMRDVGLEVRDLVDYVGDAAR